MIILAVDLGLARTGLSVCDKNELLAGPVGTVEERDPRRLLALVAETAQTRGAERIVVGHPRNMDGSYGKSALRAEKFAAALAEAAKIPVVLWDERMTTKSAIGHLNAVNARGSKRKAAVDTVAAVIILQDYLDYRRTAECE